MACSKVPNANGEGQGTEFGMHLGLVETGYDDQKIKTKMQESGTVKQASHSHAQLFLAIKIARYTERSKDLGRCHEMQQAMYRDGCSSGISRSCRRHPNICH